jgi:hypothetical protein
MNVQGEQECVGVAEASRRLGRPGRTLSDAIYRGAIDPTGWPVVAGRRVVPVSELPAIAAQLAAGRRRPAARDE